MKLDILVIAAHPDDAELSCGGTICKHVALGKKVGVVDLTRGELGTRGTPEQRLKEAEVAAEILGLSVRENLHMEDGFFRNDREHQYKVAQVVRKYRPDIVLANAVQDRHPDHGRGADLIYDSCWLAGLIKFKTELDGELQEAWRPRHVYHFIQSRYIQPDFVVDISEFWEQKLKAYSAYKSQFHDPDSNEPETFISSSGFQDLIKARTIEFGVTAGVEHAEGFTSERFPAVESLYHLI